MSAFTNFTFATLCLLLLARNILSIPGDNSDQNIPATTETKKAKATSSLEKSNSDAHSYRNVPGGVRTIDVNDSKVQEFAKLGLSQHSKDKKKSYEIVEISEATIQTVAGVKYNIKVKFGAACPEGEGGSCDPIANKEIEECIVTVISQTWINSHNVTVNCNEK